jgi:hypothetical protein
VESGIIGRRDKTAGTRSQSLLRFFPPKFSDSSLKVVREMWLFFVCRENSEPLCGCGELRSSVGDVVGAVEEIYWMDLIHQKDS